MIVHCSQCQKAIERKPSRVKYNRTGLWFCDRICAGHYQTAKRNMATCPVCGQTFYARLYRFNKYPEVTCSLKCKSVLLGWGSEEVNCAQCGKAFKRKNAELKEHNFCSRACMGQWQSENMTGENSTSWRGGWPEYYGADWAAQRRRAYERDAATCQCCGLRESDLSKALDVHHIKPFRLHDSHKQANDLRNLITLCPSCHDVADVIARRLFDQNWSNAQIVETFQNHGAILRVYLDHIGDPV